MKFTKRELDIILNALSYKSASLFDEGRKAYEMIQEGEWDSVDKEYYLRRSTNFYKDSKECDSVWLKVYSILDDNVEIGENEEEVIL